MRTIELKDSSGITFAFVEKDEDKPWIYVQWIGLLKVDELKKVMTHNINFLKETNCAYVLSDRRKSEGNLFELGHFIEHKWASIAVEAGLRCVANVTPPNAFTRFTSNDLTTRTFGFDFKSFDSLEEAEAWLLEKATLAKH
jgi:hypothetical protein